MSNPAPSLLVVGLLAPGEASSPARPGSAHCSLLDAAEGSLAATFGPVTRRSETMPFTFSDYYTAEMGPNLLRRWIAHGPVEPGRLAELKRATGRIEAEFAESGRRRVNIDPGLLSMHSLVLATTKDFAHRVYLSDGIFAEVTLLYHAGRYEPLGWTYPDYRTETCHAFLRACREALTPPRPAG